MGFWRLEVSTYLSNPTLAHEGEKRSELLWMAVIPKAPSTAPPTSGDYEDPFPSPIKLDRLSFFINLAFDPTKPGYINRPSEPPSPQ